MILGQPADMLKAPDHDLHLSAFFVRALLTSPPGDAVARRNSIVILNATIDGPLFLRNAQVDDEVTFVGCLFTGGADFRGSSFRRSPSILSSTFAKPWNVDFSGMRSGASLLLNRSTFRGYVAFDGARIAGDLHATDARFEGDYSVDFTDVRVGGGLFVSGTTFDVPVSFTLSKVGGGFYAIQAFFNSPGSTSFNSMRVGEHVHLRETIFHGPVDLGGAQIAGELNLQGAHFQQGAMLGHSKIGSSLNAEATTFDGPLDLDDASFSDFRLENDDDSNVGAVLGLLGRQRYAASTYVVLEQLYRQRGTLDFADRIFVAARERERREFLTGWRWIRATLSAYLFNYGRRPDWTFAYMALVVAIGTGVFRSERHMLRTERCRSHDKYSALLYSLDLFLPFVDLHAAERWIPPARRRAARAYMRFHILAGWILVPLGLGAIAGLVK